MCVVKFECTHNFRLNKKGSVPLLILFNNFCHQLMKYFKCVLFVLMIRCEVLTSPCSNNNCIQIITQVISPVISKLWGQELSVTSRFFVDETQDSIKNYLCMMVISICFVLRLNWSVDLLAFPWITAGICFSLWKF